MKKFSNTEIISLIDLTSLNINDTDADIAELCKKANDANTAAICIYPQFIKFAKTVLNKDIPIATVINFPNGENDLTNALGGLEFAIGEGADEIDLVMPYGELIDGDYKFVESFISDIKKNSSKKLLKVIIESGVLKSEKLIRDASKISINAGADFIKTSTGKVEVNATLEAATIMIEEIKSSGAICGFKAAGGIKTLEESLKYLSIAANIMGENFITSKTFRFGATSLLDNLLGEKGKSNY
ncbi:MAG: deoxyribose-phosphate aldolase [Alphaproteobacteria bacterium]|jgi:deoxyribose-phosphate aldolase|nr:deoxyribose-phosphate aldolase [Alphaproteobacteria bacterium]